jgi:hypothetical protein
MMVPSYAKIRGVAQDRKPLDAIALSQLPDSVLVKLRR